MSLHRMAAYTYEVRHNPNCPSPYLIVTVGSAFRIGCNGNLHSYGKTLSEAVDAALIAIEGHQRTVRDTFQARAMSYRLDVISRQYRGIVWA